MPVVNIHTVLDGEYRVVRESRIPVWSQVFTGYPGSSLSVLSPLPSTTRMLSTLVRRVLADMRSSDWSFYGGTYAAILASMVAAGGSAMYLIGPLADTAEIQARRRKRN